MVVTSLRDENITRLQMVFLQPIQIVITPNAIILKLTILERNPNSYLDDYEVIKHTRETEDDILFQNIANHFRLTFNSEFPSLDINRGVKYLWENDMIDALSVKYKRETSMATEVMDEDYTFKQQNPVRYNEVITSPLRKHAFRFITDTVDYCDFVTDPTAGNISFHKYPSDSNQINNVISEILRNN